MHTLLRIPTCTVVTLYAPGDIHACMHALVRTYLCNKFALIVQAKLPLHKKYIKILTERNKINLFILAAAIKEPQNFSWGA